MVCWILVVEAGDCIGSGRIGGGSGGFLGFTTVGGAGFVSLMYRLVMLETFRV